MVDWMWRVGNMTFDNGVVPEYLKSTVIVPLYNGKGERPECRNYRGISLFSVVEKIYIQGY